MLNALWFCNILFIGNSRLPLWPNPRRAAFHSGGTIQYSKNRYSTAPVEDFFANRISMPCNMTRNVNSWVSVTLCNWTRSSSTQRSARPKIAWIGKERNTLQFSKSSFLSSFLFFIVILKRSFVIFVSLAIFNLVLPFFPSSCPLYAGQAIQDFMREAKFGHFWTGFKCKHFKAISAPFDAVQKVY